MRLNFIGISGELRNAARQASAMVLVSDDSSSRLRYLVVLETLGRHTRCHIVIAGDDDFNPFATIDSYLLYMGIEKRYNVDWREQRINEEPYIAALESMLHDLRH